MSLSPATRARTNMTSVAPSWSGSLRVGMSVSVAVPSVPVLTSAGVDERPKGRPSTNTSALRTENPRESEMWILAVNAARERSGLGENDTLSMISWAAGALTSAASIDLPPVGSVTTLGGLSGTTTAVGTEVSVALPGVFLAVTDKRSVLSLSAATSR